ncbi:DUF4240 domain-containing protein [Nonomuraea angiospora]|uniref:DUF4240 domain-containing protein n=1 Tax=Nonomuraea angiospora TaxID=46172 RepID=UPI00344D97F0
MDIDGFWELIERSARETDTRKARLAWLENELSQRSVEDIVGYYAGWKIAQSRGCTIDLYAAYWFVFQKGSLNGFEYFVNWLISLGRSIFEQVADCPDRLIEVPEVLRLLEKQASYYSGSARSLRSRAWTDDEDPEFERLAYVPYHVCEKIGRDVEDLHEALQARSVGDGFPLIPGIAEAPRGEQWDYDDDQEVRRRLPRIARYRGLQDS